MHDRSSHGVLLKLEENLFQKIFPSGKSITFTLSGEIDFYRPLYLR